MFDRLTSAAGPSASAPAAPRVLAAERIAIRRLLNRLGDPPVAVELWNGEEVGATGDSTVARLVLHDRGALYRLILSLEFQFGELYSQGRISVEGDLVALLELVFRSQRTRGPTSRLMPDRLRALPGSWTSSKERARENIHHHYDIGNDFYRLWLDERMLYTCAYFEARDATLEAAQLAKMDHVCRKLMLRPGQHVVEAGCGWGSLAMHMARRYGVTVRAYNISHEQVAFARERARIEGLARQVEFIEDDYRTIVGQCDAFVSVGMLEHVGPGSYHTLGAVIDRCLSDVGRGLIHTIGRDRAMPVDSWIATRIFPGACPPSLKQMMDLFEPFPFSVLDVENLRLHYAITLRHWLERFEEHEREIAAMFDDRFVRMWRLYLAGSQAAFRTGWMQLFQVVFNRSTDNDLPLTRAHLHRTAQ